MVRAAVSLAEQDEARQSQPSDHEQFAEVRVGRGQNALVVTCRGQHDIVDVASKALIRHVFDIVAGIDEERRQAGADALVKGNFTPEYEAGPDAR